MTTRNWCDPDEGAYCENKSPTDILDGQCYRTVSAVLLSKIGRYENVLVFRTDKQKNMLKVKFTVSVYWCHFRQ